MRRLITPGKAARASNILSCGVLLLALTCFNAGTATADALPSWRDTATRQSIEQFVAEVTDAEHAHYVTPADRIAVFDNDGTLWAEQPVYFQLFFVLDRLRQLAPQNPQWKTQEPFKAALSGDMNALAQTGMHGIMELLMATHADQSRAEFAAAVKAWTESARHPTTGKRYTEMVYQPMLELLDYLRANEFKVYIVSGGGIEFMRVFAEAVYGVIPEQVIGSSIKTQYVVTDGQPTLQRLPEMNFVDDKEGKPVAINQHIGRRPLVAFGNSDGDFQMLEWTTAGAGPRLGALVHHTDAEREWAYDRDSHIGKLVRGLDEAEQRGWLLVDMKNDWSQVFPSHTPSN